MSVLGDRLFWTIMLVWLIEFPLLASCQALVEYKKWHPEYDERDSLSISSKEVPNNSA